MLDISTTEPYTLEQFQKALAELAEELPEHTAEGTAIKKRFLDLAKATVVWKYIDARALRATKKDKEIFSLLEYRRRIYNLAMTYPTQTECSEVQWIISNIHRLSLAEVPHEEEPWVQLLHNNAYQEEIHMGRGNVRVTGLYEGLYYIDNDYYQVFRRTDTFADDEEGMYRLLSDLSTDELNSDDWVYDAESSSCELDFILEGFIDFFCQKYASFTRPQKDTWLAYPHHGKRVILESNLFYICAEDNEWSTAIELIQKDSPYDDHLVGLQKTHFAKYLDGMKEALLNSLPCIGFYTGPWTHGVLTRGETA